MSKQCKTSIDATIAARSAAITNDEDHHLPDHLIRVPGAQWALWRWVGLRGAGFPATLPLRLSAPACAAAADHLLEVESEVERTRRAAIDALRSELESGGGQQQAGIEKALRRLRKGKLPESFDSKLAAREGVDQFRAACADADRRLADFHSAFKLGGEQVSQAIYEVAGMELFREALIWQNRNAFHTGIEPLTRKAPGESSRGTKHRQHEELVANYLQRYCLKNDTIGFFGPVGWATLTNQGDAMVTRPGPSLVRSRTVYFEAWCMDALAKTLSTNRALRPWLAPRRICNIHIEGNTLYVPFRPPSVIPEKHATILQACNGETSASELAALMCLNYPNLIGSKSEVLGILEGLSARGLIAWALEVPASLEAERILSQKIHLIGDDDLRASTLKQLEELQGARGAVEDSAGNADMLDQSLRGLESAFIRLTDMGSTRNAGQTYAGRTLVYEDCCRNIEVEIGPAIIESLAPPLSLLLTSARWLTFNAAATYRELFKSIHAEISRNTGQPVIDAINFVLRIRTLLVEENSQLLDPVITEFQRRWAEILSIPEGQHEVSYSSEQLRPRVLEAFDAPHTGWSFARYNSPDLMIAARSVEEIKRGEYLMVLGEFHMGVNTLGAEFFMEQHPDKAELIKAAEYDMPAPRLEVLRGINEIGTSARSIIGLIAPKDYLLSIYPETFGRPPYQSLPIGELVIENVEGELILRTRDGRLQFEIVEGLGSIVSGLVMNSFKIMPRRAYTPRISIDRLVIIRESWSFPASQIQFAHEKDEATRFLEARRWACARGLPRFVFAKTPKEVKPFYVDFASPIYVNILAKMIRRVVESNGIDSLISMSEMLPSAEQTWLPDSQAQSYTSELRIITLDLAR